MIVKDFLVWHYFKAYNSLLTVELNYLELALHLFSVKYLIKTLFSPWRRMEAGDSTGFSLDKLGFNLVSRLMGFTVRFILIILGLITTLLFFLILSILFVVWFFLSPISWLIYLKLNQPQPDKTILQGKSLFFCLKRLGLKNQEELANVPKEDIEAVLAWYWKLEDLKIKQKRFWDKENLLRAFSLGSSLAFGYTLELDKFSQNLASSQSFSHQLIGRDKEIKQIENALCSSYQGNVLLIGEPGVGKKTILMGFAKAILENRVTPKLFFKRVLQLNMHLILGSVGGTEQAKAKLMLILKEAEIAGNVILVIDEIDKYISNQEGIDLTSAFDFMLQSRKINIIGIATPANFERFIFPNSQIVKYFNQVEVVPPNKEEALDILERVIPDFEKNKKTFVTYQALKEITSQTDALITNIPFPEKAIDILDQLIAWAQITKKPLITKEDVDILISQKVKIPIGNLSDNETNKLQNLDKIMHDRIVGQQGAVTSLVSAMKRARLGVSDTGKPLGVFLFLGPTGVGKTETAKAVAQSWFGDEKQMIRFDMSQYQTLDAINSLIGNSALGKPGLLVEEVRQNPYAVLLLDEFEKSPKEILNIFLSVFDEGFLKDSNAKIVSFKNLIIICTSNAASEFIRQKVKIPQLDTIKFKSEVMEYILEQNIFSPELINRFDEVVIYKTLNLEEIEQIAKIQIRKLQTRLKQKRIVLQIDENVYSLIANLSYSLEFGARPMKRLITDKIENIMAQKMLDGEIKTGDDVKLTVDRTKKEFKIEKVS